MAIPLSEMVISFFLLKARRMNLVTFPHESVKISSRQLASELAISSLPRLYFSFFVDAGSESEWKISS